MRRISTHNIRRWWQSSSSSIQSCNRCTVQSSSYHHQVIRRTIQSSSYYQTNIGHSSFSTTTATLNSDDTTNNDHNNNNTKHVAKVRSALSSSPVPYEVGWAYQHVLLHRRLNYMRMMQKQKKQQNNATTNANSKDSAADQEDIILLFEHEPVYTLGRGASEDHLTFLNKESDGGIEKRRRLNRKYRGVDASRLNIDTSKAVSADLQHKEMSVEEEVNHLLQTSLLNNKTTTKQPVLAPNNIPIYRIERGGEVTYHGPGQLVMYPLLNLKQSNYKQDLHWYLRQIEQVIIDTLSHYNIQSNRDSINTGVWVNHNKIAAVGVSSSRWITTHGLAINVSPNLNHFDKEIMIPCGIDGRGVTSMKELLGGDAGDTCCPSVEEVGEVALSCFENVFNVELERDTDTIR